MSMTVGTMEDGRDSFGQVEGKGYENFNYIISIKVQCVRGRNDKG